MALKTFGQGLAVGAGLCGALAATCAKLAMAAESAEETCHSVISALMDDRGEDFCTTMLLYVRIGFFGLIFFFNALMWILFVRSLQMCSSSIVATVTNTGANIFSTAVIGWLLFGESLTLTWWSGASLILIGLVLIHRGSPQQEESTTKKEDISKKMD